MSHAFQVDLRGVVDLLSRHLYASPRVYLRELLQNAVDAITARRGIEGDAAPAEILIEPPELTGDGSLRIHDTGIGLTEAQVHELLATIGHSSKRDDLGFARHDFLGQFGIGLLSCFLVADTIVVETRAGDSPTVRWTGHADGRYEVEFATRQRADSGTTVIVTPRPGAQEWLAAETVTELARLYGSFLPAGVTVGSTLITDGPPPWQRGRQALLGYAVETLGLDPFDVIELSVPEAGLTGAAFVLRTPTNPGSRAGHRVYLKRMLLTESAEGLLPDWAFFARCVIDATELRPTASREALYEDGLLHTVREALGDQLRGWLVRLAAQDPDRLSEFLSVHHLGVKALARYDDEMLRLVEQWWPVETNVGRMTLSEFRERYGILRYTAGLDQFRALAAVAAAQQVALINAAYAYEADLIERLSTVDPDVHTERLDPSDLATRLDSLDPGLELALRHFLVAAQRALDPLGCEVVLRSFDPPGLAALYLLDRDAAFRGELRATKERVDPVWADVLAALENGAHDDRPQLVLNHRNPLVRRITVLGNPAVIALATEALYGQALLLGHHPIRPADATLLNRSFLGLLDLAVPRDQGGAG